MAKTRDAVMAKRKKTQRIKTSDSYQNFIAHVGRGTGNIHDASNYKANFITQYKDKLDQLYRSEWLIGEIVDAVADDMTWKGVIITSKLEQTKKSLLLESFNDLYIMKSINKCLKLARLYGGSLGIIAIDGADLSTPLKIDRIEKNSFKGIIPVDRWHITPSSEVITDFGNYFGKPAYYVLNDVDGFNFNQRVHYSRVLRFEGIELPEDQKKFENGWGMSVIERVLDTLMRFDSSTVGASQLVYKAHLRTYKVHQLREIIAMGGQAYDALLKQLEMIRLYQSNEGLTLLDSQDDFFTSSYGFNGLSDIIEQLSLQLSASAKTPMVRLFGQSPAGFNTGETDLRNYHDRIEVSRSNELRHPIKYIFEILHVSLFNESLLDGFSFKFGSLGQMSITDKTNLITTVVNAVRDCYNDGLISRKQALIELKQFANDTGMGSSISDEDIESAEEEIPCAGDVTEIDHKSISKSITEDSAGSRKISHDRLRWF